MLARGQAAVGYRSSTYRAHPHSATSGKGTAVADTNEYAATFNLVDSADGLMIGLASWAEGFFIIAAMDSGQHDMAIYCSILLGGSLALGFFNSYPAFLFM